MRNLFSFIYRIHVLLLFILLQAICVYLIVLNNRYDRAAFLNVSDEFTGHIFDAYNNVAQYLNLAGTNSRLAEQNSRLMNSLASSYYKDTSHQVLKVDSAKHPLYSYIPARVIQITTNENNNYLYINKGKDEGITPHMAVIGPDGVVGIVKNVSNHFSSAFTLLHSQVTVSGRVGRQGSRGTIRWDGKDASYVNLEEITRQEKLSKGDTIFTSGVSRLFPDNIPIGTIENFSLKEPGNFYDIRIKLTTDFRKLDYVYVISNLYHNELDSLIQKTNAR
jgi:rod shape-determining protein MreC